MIVKQHSGIFQNKILTETPAAVHWAKYPALLAENIASKGWTFRLLQFILQPFKLRVPVNAARCRQGRLSSPRPALGVPRGRYHGPAKALLS